MPLAQEGMILWCNVCLLSNGMNIGDMLRRLTMFLKMSHLQKHHQLGLEGMKDKTEVGRQANKVLHAVNRLINYSVINTFKKKKG